MSLQCLFAENITRPQKQLHAHAFPTPQSYGVTGACEGLVDRLGRRMEIMPMNKYISRQSVV